MVTFNRADLDFIFKQILIAEDNAAGTPMLDLLPNVVVPWGLRTLTGVGNSLINTQWGAADNSFPRLTTPSWVTVTNTGITPLPPFPFSTNYQTPGNVVDADPRIISNLIVDQTTNNPAANAALLGSTNNSFEPVVGSVITSPGLDGLFSTSDDVTNVNFIPNVKPDFNLTVPFNSWFTFFGQFFDHGLDLVQKSATEVVFVPLQPDDPLYKPGSPTNFMVLSRALPNALNVTSPFVDQNQTYTSHPSHQVFLREYVKDASGHPIATGRLITRHDLGADGKFGTADDVDKGGMATWATVKAQARDLLGIQLTDADVGSVPLLRTDDYGNFIKGPNGFPLVITGIGADGIPNTADDTVIEGDPTANGGLGISLATAVRTAHQFLNDIAHNAVPVFSAPGVLAPDADNVVNIGAPPPAGTYDNELLDAHYIAGDGRVNENIGLTAVHDIFHSEHNRLVGHTKSEVIASKDVAFVNQWLLAGAGNQITQGQLDAINAIVDPIARTTAIDALHWNGERLFQAAKFGTEMQYQHLVFEEFARTIQPNIDEFLAPNGYDVQIDASIVAEFAHTVYRFGHSMLTETVDRLDPNFNPITADPLHPTNDQQIGLIAAFLNPLAYAASGLTNEQATGAIVRGVTRQVGNEIDEFVTEALRNNLVGLPLDLPTLNIARGRDTGIPSLNDARKEFYHLTSDQQLKPYISWVDFMKELKHPESLINFIAAYGTHQSLTTIFDATLNGGLGGFRPTNLAEKRNAATLLVLGDGNDADGVTINGVTYTDRLDFLNSTGAWANTTKTMGGADKTLGTADDFTAVQVNTGLDRIDFWIGGLAERQMPNGGLLGATFNFVFETQLEALQNGDRFYYLSRTAGLHFGVELEQNSFAKLVMLNSNATHLPADIFQTPAYILEVDPTKQFTGLGVDGKADPSLANGHAGITINGVEITPLVIRDNPNTPGLDTNYLHYTGSETVVLGGTAGNDILIAGSSDDDTIWGDAGNDRLDGGDGNDNVFGGAGDDIITSAGGNDNLDGGDGNDVIFDSHSMLPLDLGNLIKGGKGQDFIYTFEDISTVFAGEGNDFILGAKSNLPEMGGEGDDWIEWGTQDGAPGDNMNPFLLDDIPGNDIFVGGSGFDEMIGEGGDDIFVGSDGQTKMDGMSGFDWATYKNDKFGITVDMRLPIFAPAHGNPIGTLATAVGQSPSSILDRFAEVEGLSGSKFADILIGDNQDANIIATITAKGSVLTNISLINGLQEFLDQAMGMPAGAHVTSFGTGNIILGGDGSDIITPLGGDDLIDGDKWLNVRVSVRQSWDPVTNTPVGPEIASFDSLNSPTLLQNMLNGVWNPGQLQAVREILPGTANATGRQDNFDTVNFQGRLADYTIAVNGTVLTPAQIALLNGGTGIGAEAVVTVTDNSLTPRDGIDRLVHVERLQFSDQAVVLRQGLNAQPVGQLGVLGATGVGGTPETGDTLKVSTLLDGTIIGVTDADNPGGTIRNGVTFTWQQEKVPGSGVFEDIVLLGGRVGIGFPIASTNELKVTDALTGLALRVKATYQDAHGVTEQVFSAPTAAVVVGVPAPPPAFVPPPVNAATSEGKGVHFIRSDLDFILAQIKIAERNAAGEDLVNLVSNVRAPEGLRTVDGSFNNLINTHNINSSEFGAADNVFPRLTSPAFMKAEAGSSYTQTNGLVIDSQPRTISNLIVDQTANNPAAVAAAAQNDGASLVKSPGLDGVFDTADDKDVFFIPNVKPDFGLTAPFNAWFTFFGQFFDHGLDLVSKGGNGTVFVPLKADDPLFVPGSPTNFMVLTRATMLPGPDGKLGTADDIHENSNTTSPFVDQNQTYTSHPSHQVFLREYALDANGHPVATGRLITNHEIVTDVNGVKHLGAEIGGMATWEVVKIQARDLLGLNLTDKQVFDVPLLATDAYGNFIKGSNGLPQAVIRVGNGADGIAGTADDVTTLVEGNRAAPIDLTSSVSTGHQFLNDIAHSADPSGGLTPDADAIINIDAPLAAGTYDNELLDKHYIAGDGRVNENIGLTAVHSIFHHEHNRLVEQTKQTAACIR